MQTVLLFALPEEYTDFIKVTGPWQLTHRTPFKRYSCPVAGRELVTVETGMGERRSLAALHWLRAWARPDLIIAAGFAGSLSKDLAVGDVCLGESLSPLEEDRHALPFFEAVTSPLQEADALERHGASAEMAGKSPVTFHLENGAQIASRLERVGGEACVHLTRIVTVSKPVSKPLLARKFADRVSVVDMESCGAARFCYECGIPFLSLRAVSDGLWDEIDFDPLSICDGEGHVRIPLVLLSVMKSPRLIGSYYRSWKRSRTAARSLGSMLAELIALPVEELGALANFISYYRS